MYVYVYTIRDEEDECEVLIHVSAMNHVSQSCVRVEKKSVLVQARLKSSGDLSYGAPNELRN